MPPAWRGRSRLLGLSPDGGTALAVYRLEDELAFALVTTPANALGLLDIRIPFEPTDPIPPRWAANNVVLVQGVLGTALPLTLEKTSG